MTFEDELAALNVVHFFREFTYSKTTFRPSPAKEVELADSIIWLGDLLIIYQLKSRAPQGATTRTAENGWFRRKVLKQATRQVRDTLAYLRDAGPIQISNHRGHVFDLDLRTIREIHKLIVYFPHAELPLECRMLKHHRSRTAGVIHLIPANDYLGIVRTLLTPTEVAEYLSFRENLAGEWETEVNEISEPALVGQYLNGATDVRPSIGFIEDLARLDHQTDEWDMSGIIKQFADRIITGGGATDYYAIVRELALLKRNELREFKQRFKLCIDKAKANEFQPPYRMACPRTNCGFVFIPVIKELLAKRRNGLQNYTLAHKYELKLPKCVGVSIADDGEGWFTVEWFYTQFRWEPDTELEDALKRSYPFREVKQVEIARYTYREPE